MFWRSQARHDRKTVEMETYTWKLKKCVSLFCSFCSADPVDAVYGGQGRSDDAAPTVQGSVHADIYVHP